MEIDPIFIHIVTLSLAILISAIFSNIVKQPPALTHIITGIIIGPFALGLISDEHLIQNLGEFGIILLLFFIGMETSFKGIAKQWKIIMAATLLHTIASVGVILLFGLLSDWPVSKSIMIGFVISLSSTAVLLRYFEERKTLDTKLGREITGILLTQDIMVIPMMLTLSILSKNNVSVSASLIKFTLSLFFVFVIFVIFKTFYQIIKTSSVSSHITNLIYNAEIGLFAGISLCFGFAYLTTYLNLSPGLGAFMAGILFSSMNMPQKVRKRLVPFKIFFMALFFMSIGLLIDIDFLLNTLPVIFFLVFIVFAFNTLVRAFFFRCVGEDWKYSFYASALLAHIGEFSFFIAAAGLHNGLASNYSYQITIIVIAISILLSPTWIKLFSRFHPLETTQLAKT